MLSLALRLPGGLQCRALGKETGSKSLPSDAAKTFAAAMGGALEELPALLRKGEGDECAWLDNPAPKRQESLRPRLPYFLAQLVTAGAEVRPTQPHLELGAACQVNGMREVRSRCSCGWANSLWDAVASSIQGDTRNETGHCCTACSKCSAVLEPLLTLRKRLPRAVIDRSHSELSISTSAIAGDAAQIHLLIVKECLKRIASRNLETSENLLEDDPEVYWCLQVFFGLKAEVFWRSSGPLVSLSVTSFKDMCRNFLAEAKAQEGEPSLPGAVATEDSKEEVAAAALPKEAVQNVETFEQLAKKVSSRRHHSVEPPASFPTEREPSPGILKRGSRRASTARTITLGDIEDAPEEESKEASRPKEPEVPELSFVHVNMEALLEPYPELPAPPVLKQRPRAERRRSGPARPRAFKEERSVRQVGSPSSPFRAPVRVKKPATVVAKHRPLVVLLPGEGYAKRSKAVAFDSPRKGRAGYSSMDEENRLVQEIAQLSRRIEQLRAGNG
ncbi:unnamed protein product [Effrenium voratum]|uniref:Uncharacterized protein n=1 Tax=Effrenium voratum TaxID=2562239 RepID=A0AA36I1G7_9DINO|nr:unnamed protein product [Effrenium voratum]